MSIGTILAESAHFFIFIVLALLSFVVVVGNVEHF